MIEIGTTFKEIQISNSYFRIHSNQFESYLKKRYYRCIINDYNYQYHSLNYC